MLKECVIVYATTGQPVMKTLAPSKGAGPHLACAISHLLSHPWPSKSDSIRLYPSLLCNYVYFSHFSPLLPPIPCPCFVLSFEFDTAIANANAAASEFWTKSKSVKYNSHDNETHSLLGLLTVFLWSISVRYTAPQGLYFWAENDNIIWVMLSC